MKGLFVDTGAFVAKELESDRFHAVAADCWQQIDFGNFRLISSEHVFDESTTLIGRRTNFSWASGWGTDALASHVEWLRAEEGEWSEALRMMEKFADQRISFTDCLSAVLMKRERLKNIFSFDRHFEALGFRLWKGTK